VYVQLSMSVFECVRAVIRYVLVSCKYLQLTRTYLITARYKVCVGTCVLGCLVCISACKFV